MSDPFDLLRRLRPDDETVPPVQQLWDRLEQSPEPPRAPVAARRPARWRAALAVTAVIAVCLAISAAAVGLLSHRAPTVSNSAAPPIHAGLKEILGVLRGPRSADRQLDPTLRRLGRMMGGRYRIDRADARVAAHVRGYPPIVLVPVRPTAGGPLQLATIGGGGGSCCLTASSIQHGTATSTWGGSSTKNYGMIIVPDGVARVTLRIGHTLTAVVRHNVAIFQLPGPIGNLGVYPMAWLSSSGAVIRRFHTHATTKAPRSHPQYPARIYPPPVRFPQWGQPGSCASLSGVRQPSSHQDARARDTVLMLLDDHAQALADRAYWPVLAHQKRAHLTAANLLATGPASQSPYAGLIRSRCGAGLVTHSIRVLTGPPHSSTSSPALTTEYWVINRRGHWLVWWSQN